MADAESFSKRMRRETREVHKISDALINAKLAFGTYTLHTVAKNKGCDVQKKTVATTYFLE